MAAQRDNPPRVLGYFSATAIVVANMVGTGVFTTLGLQAGLVTDPALLLGVWAAGGLIAFCGALCYAELGASLPRSGGEYHFLSRIYHPVVGLAAGVVSVTVGFAAPVALAAMALGRYAATFLPVSPGWTAVASLLVITAFHLVDVRLGQRFQVVTTALKLVLIGVFITAGLLAEALPGNGVVTPTAAPSSTELSLALVFVFYAYSGWNAAAYVASEIAAPERTLPRALLHGTALVTVAYLLLNYVFLKTVPLAELAGTVEIGALSAARLFGATGGAIMSGMLCLLLISTISAMVLAGPRVLQIAGEDISLLRPLARRTRRGAPARAVALQLVIALTFVATGSFENVLAFAGFTLTLFAGLTALGVVVLRVNEPELPRPWRTWGYPVTPWLFVLASSAVLGMALQERPLAGLAALVLTVAALAASALQWRGRNAA
jgi:APA family basic amino acid/polyamine antiporter